MNIYDFDKTIYDGDSTADFYIYCLKKHKKILRLAPSLAAAFIKYYIFKRGTKTDFKQVMYRFLKFCDAKKDAEDFWKINKNKIKKFYLAQQRKDDVIISASPEFLLEPICGELKIYFLIASEVNPETGIYKGINCHGKEKVRRFYEIFGKECKVEKFYSDSLSDTPMAQIADKAFSVKGEKISEWKFKN